MLTLEAAELAPCTILLLLRVPLASISPPLAQAEGFEREFRCVAG